MGQKFQPTLLDAAQALVAEQSQAGTHPELTPLLATPPSIAKTLLPGTVGALLVNPGRLRPQSAESPSATQLADSRATVLYN